MEQSLSAHVGDKEVTVSTLRVDGKKMTLQFFKQIPKISYFTDNDEPDPTLLPWGRINYAIASEGKEWLLVEKEKTLFKCCIDLPSVSDWEIEHHLKGAADAKQKISEYAGKKFFENLLKTQEENFSRHSKGIEIAKNKLLIAQKKFIFLQKLQELPQLYLA